MSQSSDHWGSGADKYAELVEERTQVATRDLVEMTDEIYPFDTPGASAFDIGCGTGALSKAIKAKCSDIPLLSADLSSGMVAHLEKHSESHSWKNHRTDILNANDLSNVSSNSFTHSMTSFMIVLIPTPHLAVSELYRVTKPGGVIGIANWCASRTMVWPAWENARRKLDPTYIMPHSMDVYWSDPESSKEGFEKAGFKDVVVRVKDYEWPVESEETFEKVVWEGQNPHFQKCVVEPFLKSGGTREEIKPHFLRELRDQFGDGKGVVRKGYLKVTLITGRK